MKYGDIGRKWSKKFGQILETEDETTDGCMASQLDGQKFEEAPGVDDRKGSWCAAVHGVAKSQALLVNELN